MAGAKSSVSKVMESSATFARSGGNSSGREASLTPSECQPHVLTFKILLFKAWA